MNGARATPRGARTAPKTHVQTSQPSRGTLAASGRTDRVRSAISWHGHHDDLPRAPPLVDASSSTPGPPYVAEAFGAHRARATRGRPEPSLTEQKPGSSS